MAIQALTPDLTVTAADRPVMVIEVKARGASAEAWRQVLEYQRRLDSEFAVLVTPEEIRVMAKDGSSFTLDTRVTFQRYGREADLEHATEALLTSLTIYWLHDLLFQLYPEPAVGLEKFQQYAAFRALDRTITGIVEGRREPIHAD